MKIYLKRGKHNYKDQKLIDAIENAINEKIKADPNYKPEFSPATNQEELQLLYNKFVPETVQFTETKTEQKSGENSDKNSNTGSSPVKMDPLNDGNKIVRSYVTSSDSLGNSRVKPESGQSTFEEPKTFSEAFTIPEFDDEGNPEKEDKSSSKSTGYTSKPPKEEPINPEARNMSSSRRRKSSRKIAEKIVDIACAAAKLGIVWYLNKDITAAKIMEYDASGEYDFDVLLKMPNDVEFTARQYFEYRRVTNEQLINFDEEDKLDFAESLEAYFSEKGIVLSTGQQCLVDGAALFTKPFFVALQISVETKSILQQLRKDAPYEGAAPQYESEQTSQQESPQNNSSQTLEEILNNAGASNSESFDNNSLTVTNELKE